MVGLDAESECGGLIAGYDDQEGEEPTGGRNGGEKTGRSPRLELTGCPGAGQQPHDQAEIIARDMDQVALVQVLPAAQPRSAHATTIEDQREAPLDAFGAQLERRPGNPGQKAGAVVDDGTAGLVVAVPAREA